MDSLTQIILGAACGEVVAGRRLGNRAMLWGAVGGTIPDLDVFAAFFTDEIGSTSFHRGFMHSFLFAVLAPWVLAWLARWFYGEGIYRRQGFKAGAMAAWLLFYIGAAVGINFIPVLLGEGLKWYILLPTLLLGAWLGWRLWTDYWRKDLELVEVPYRVWALLFFWSIFTHPILDCFTSWGTQVWQPFLDTRIQWNTVSVVDPIATIPFGILLLIASRFRREDRRRSWWNWAGLLWFCGYLGYTVWHKQVVNDIFEKTLQARGIRYQRFMTGPTIFNNIVWSGVAEGDTAYYMGLYGFNDSRQEFAPISVVPKNHQLLDKIPPETRAGYFLRWFTNGYYNVLPYRGDSILEVNDLRFGLLGDSLRGANYVFPFLVMKNDKGEWKAIQHNRDKHSIEANERAFGELWRRVSEGRK